MKEVTYLSVNGYTCKAIISERVMNAYKDDGELDWVDKENLILNQNHYVSEIEILLPYNDMYMPVRISHQALQKIAEIVGEISKKTSVGEYID